MSNRKSSDRLKRAITAAALTLLVAAALVFVYFLSGSAERQLRSDFLPYIKIGSLIFFAVALIYFIFERKRGDDERGEALTSGIILFFTALLSLSVFLYPAVYDRCGRLGALYMAAAIAAVLFAALIVLFAPLPALIPYIFAPLMIFCLRDMGRDLVTGEGKLSGIAFGSVILPALLVIIGIIFFIRRNKTDFLSSAGGARSLIALGLFSALVFILLWMKYITGTLAIIFVAATSALAFVYITISAYLIKKKKAAAEEN